MYGIYNFAKTAQLIKWLFHFKSHPFNINEINKWLVSVIVIHLAEEVERKHQKHRQIIIIHCSHLAYRRKRASILSSSQIYNTGGARRREIKREIPSISSGVPVEIRVVRVNIKWNEAEVWNERRWGGKCKRAKSLASCRISKAWSAWWPSTFVHFAMKAIADENRRRYYYAMLRRAYMAYNASSN